MDEARATLEHLAQAVCGALEKELGKPVEIGLHGRWDDDEVRKRAVPLRASVVELAPPLADCIVGVTTMREDPLRTALTAAVAAIAESLGCEVEPITPEIHELEEREEALEQLDALYNEATLHFTTPKGDLLIVVGSGLVAVASALLRGEQGAQEPAAGVASAHLSGEPAAGAPLATAVAGGSAVENELGVGAAGVDADGPLIDGGAAAAGGHGGERPFTGLPGNPMMDTAVENARAADPQMEQLLSGVEVDVSAELGRTSMRLGDITSLASESVLTLDQLVDDPVRVYVNGQLFGTARLVVVDDEYGIEMLEVFEQAPLGFVQSASQQSLAA